MWFIPYNLRTLCPLGICSFAALHSSLFFLSGGLEFEWVIGTPWYAFIHADSEDFLVCLESLSWHISLHCLWNNLRHVRLFSDYTMPSPVDTKSADSCCTGTFAVFIRSNSYSHLQSVHKMFLKGLVEKQLSKPKVFLHIYIPSRWKGFIHRIYWHLFRISL